ncbi:Cation-independent mannose-6-phosphate receptor CI-MPR [Onygenales sp. PD_40]|nr:Cation-independent mannose-6-phosphate receptor CI-MPR [Onygenales sp. PD_40]KAK2780826.1 Cation-independent mannose-6-phosphate receptor CI-MPR [Emmonsiellopsis sp. PD_33]KAK2789037.1 Cation-independent mannose-6-phosphate receptor CI-MPR [Onygenales sp. PD_12]
MRPSTSTFLATAFQLLFLCSSTSRASDSSNHTPKPCTITSPTSGAYFDLSTISLSPPEMKDGKKVHTDSREDSWHAKGYDYPANFTINVCQPVIEELKDVVGVEESRWGNVSAYYQLDGKTYSIGQQAAVPVFRGRRLVLNYTDGSPCPAPTTSNLLGREIIDGDNDHDNNTDPEPETSSRRKSTIISFHCDRDLISPAATVSFVGTMDSCSYFFEVRSAAACGGVAASADGGLGPAGVFGVIMLIAIAVYLLGGCAYQRTVMHQRGWRQCPNYSLWAGAVSFLGDLMIIIFSSISRCLRVNKPPTGYSQFSNGESNYNDRRGGLVGAIGGRGGISNGGGSGRGRRTDVEEENRLIDQLDEEWDD